MCFFVHLPCPQPVAQAANMTIAGTTIARRRHPLIVNPPSSLGPVVAKSPDRPGPQVSLLRNRRGGLRLGGGARAGGRTPTRSLRVGRASPLLTVAAPKEPKRSILGRQRGPGVVGLETFQLLLVIRA